MNTIFWDKYMDLNEYLAMAWLRVSFYQNFGEEI